MRPQDAMAVRGKLLECATAEFIAYGFAKANVGRIATAANISKKTIYKYFSSKQSLLVAVLEDHLIGSSATLGAPNTKAELSTRLRLFLRAFAIVAFSEKGVASYRLVMSEGPHFPEFARIYIDTIRDLGVAPLAREIAAYRDAGEIEVEDPHAAASMLLGMVVAEPLRDAALGIVAAPGPEEIEALVTQSVAIFLNGVRRVPPLIQSPSGRPTPRTVKTPRSP